MFPPDVLAAKARLVAKVLGIIDISSAGRLRWLPDLLCKKVGI